MSALPRVKEATHERVARDFDDRGVAACVAQIVDGWRKNNPELLDIAMKCTRDLGNSEELMLGFAMFYRLLVAEAATKSSADQAPLLDPLPHVTVQTRRRIAFEIERGGPESFTHGAIEELEQNNPELLRLAHRFAERQRNYLGAMQGFALLYACLVAQSAGDRRQPH